MKQTGFQGSGRSIRDYIFGQDVRLPPILNADWRNHLPKGERQNRKGLETMSCVSQSFCNVLEIRQQALGIEVNYSDRALAKASNTSKQGNTFWTVWMTGRKKGITKEQSWTWTDEITTWDEYYSDILSSVEQEMLDFTKNNDIRLVWVEGEQGIKEGLKRCPIWVANSYHAMVIIGEYNKDNWLVFDSYPGSDNDFVGTMPKSSVTASAMVWIEPKLNEDIKNILTTHNKKLVMDAEQSGAMGWIVDGKIRKASKERVAEMIANYIVDKEGVPLSADIWNKLDHNGLITEF